MCNITLVEGVVDNNTIHAHTDTAALSVVCSSGELVGLYRARCLAAFATVAQ